MTSHEPEVPGGGTAGKIEALPFDTAWRTSTAAAIRGLTCG